MYPTTTLIYIYRGFRMANKEKLRPISTVGGRIQHLRLQQGMSREELHERLIEKGVGHLQSYNPDSKKSTIAYLERGYYPNGRPCRPTFEEICALCDIFGCSADYLLCRIETKTHEMKEISNITGLDPVVVENLIKRKENAEEQYLHAFNVLLNDKALFLRMVLYVTNESLLQNELFVESEDVQNVMSGPSGMNVGISSKNGPMDQVITINGVPMTYEVSSALFDRVNMDIIKDCLDKLREEYNKYSWCRFGRRFDEELYELKKDK